MSFLVRVRRFPFTFNVVALLLLYGLGRLLRHAVFLPHVDALATIVGYAMMGAGGLTLGAACLWWAVGFAVDRYCRGHDVLRIARHVRAEKEAMSRAQRAGCSPDAARANGMIEAVPAYGVGTQAMNFRMAANAIWNKCNVALGMMDRPDAAQQAYNTIQEARALADAIVNHPRSGDVPVGEPVGRTLR